MRVTSVSLFADDVEVASFALRRESAKSRYMVRQIVGLDADELTPKFYGFGAHSGQKFYNFGMKARTLVIRVILNPTFALNEEYNDVRDELYKAISSTRSGLVEVRFFSGGASVSKLTGFITKLEAGYFNKTPEAQLTIRCDDPMFRGMNPVRLVGDKIPTTNPIRLADSSSTAPHGFSAEVTVTAAIPSFTVQDRQTNPDWAFTVMPNGGFLAGDVLYFSSDYAAKDLKIIRAGAPIYLIDRIQPGSIWPILFPGATELYFVNHGSFNWNYFEYHSAFWGV